jgi:outer membrane protein W
MKVLLSRLQMLSMICSFGVALYGQDLSTRERSVVELQIGLWGGASVATTASAGEVSSDVKTTAFLGGLGYRYGFEEEVALTVHAVLLAARASSSVAVGSVNQQTSMVMPLLVGVRYYVPTPETDSRVRPYLAAGIGPYFGFQSESTELSQESRMESAFGGMAGAGIEMFLSRHFTIGVGGGYNVMSDFSEPIGGRRNYNGGQAAFTFAYLF